MAQRELKRGTNLDGVYYPPGTEVDDEVFTFEKLYEEPDEEFGADFELPDADADDDGGTDEPVKKPAKKAAPKKKAPAKKATSSS